MNLILQEVFRGEIITQPQPSCVDYWVCRRRSNNARRSLMDGCAVIVLAQAENATKLGYEMSERDKKARKFAFQLYNSWSNHAVHCLLVKVKGSKLYYVRPGKLEELIKWQRWKKIVFSESLLTPLVSTTPTESMMSAEVP